MKQNRKLVHECGFIFFVRASEQTKRSPQNQENSGFWAQIPRNRIFCLACLYGEVSRGEKMTLRGTDPESYIILQYTKKIWSRSILESRGNGSLEFPRCGW